MIVCEVGLNHLGNEEYSTMYVEKLSKSKCDAISYQIREPKFYEKDKIDTLGIFKMRELLNSNFNLFL